MAEVGNAVIPAAGRGTRMAPLFPSLAKEMIPLGGVPLIQRTLEEAVQGGIRRVVVIVSPDKGSISEHLRKLGEEGQLGEVELSFVTQPEPLGLAHAIECGREHLEGRPFAVLLPDNAALSPRYSLSLLTRLYREHKREVLGIVEVEYRQRGLFGHSGMIDFEETGPGVVEIRRLYDKQAGTLQVAPGERLRRACGRYICCADFFDFVDAVRPAVFGEFDDVPVLQRIVARRGAVGGLIPPPFFDAGHPAGYRAAAECVSGMSCPESAAT